MSESELSGDELELLDVSDEEGSEELEMEADGESDDEVEAGSPFRRVADAAGAAVAGLVTALQRSIGSASESIGRTTAPLASRVPAAALAGALGFAGVLVATLIGASLLGGGKPAEASLAVAPAPTPPRALAVPREPPAHLPTPIAAGHAPTPTPATFQPQGEGWLAVGRFSPEPRQVMPAGRLLLFDDDREAFTIETTMSVLLASGPLAPWWGILLSYQGEQEHVRLEFFTDSYDRKRPYVGLLTTKNGPSKASGPSVRLPNMDFWGRDRYQLRVVVEGGSIGLWLDGKPVNTWKLPGGLPPGRKGLYVWGNSRLHFDAFSIG
ncbi:MAG TPA: hypothetical protein VGM69_26540 [Chloroflexota bacterium]